MTLRQLLNVLRLHQGLLACWLLWLMAVTMVASLLLGEWWALALACGGFVLGLANYPAIRRWVHLQRGLRALRQGKPAEAAEPLLQALAGLGPLDPRRGQALAALVQARKAAGDYTEAEPLAQQALAAQEQTWGEGHQETSAAQLALAGIYIEVARYDDAWSLLDRTLGQFEQALGSEHVGLVGCLRLLGRLWCEQGRLVRAEPFVRRARDLCRRRYLRMPALCVLSTCELAQVCAGLQQLAEAEELAQFALELAEGEYGHEHPLVALSLDQLAQVRYLQGRWAEAETVQRRSLSVTEKAGGRAHPTAAVGLHQLGAILKAQERWAEAEECCQRALQLRQDYLAPAHPALAESLESVADVLRHTGRADEAEPLAQRAGQIRALYAPLRLV